MGLKPPLRVRSEALKSARMHSFKVFQKLAKGRKYNLSDIY